MRLNEAGLQTEYVQKFKDAKYPKDKSKIIKEFCKNNGFPNYNEQDFNNFVDNNLYALQLECNTYNLSDNNPFFQFLKRYLEKNGNIKPFISDNWNILHNCVSNGVLTTKQLSFRCPADEEIKILLNPNLWNIKPSSDILYLIKLYNWFLEENLNRYVINAYVRAVFSTYTQNAKGQNKLNTNKTDNLNLLTNRISLINLTFFTDKIKTLSDDRKTRSDSDRRDLRQLMRMEDKGNNNTPYSATFQPVDMIENQVGMLREQVQENNVFDIDNNSDIESETNGQNKNQGQQYTRSEVNQVLYKSKPIIDAINKTYGNGYTNLSKADLRNILNILSDNIT